MKTLRVVLILFAGLAAAQGRYLLEGNNNYCVTETRAIDFVSPYLFDFDSQTPYDLEVNDVRLLGFGSNILVTNLLVNVHDAGMRNQCMGSF